MFDKFGIVCAGVVIGLYVFVGLMFFAKRFPTHQKWEVHATVVAGAVIGIPIANAMREFGRLLYLPWATVGMGIGVGLIYFLVSSGLVPTIIKERKKPLKIVWAVLWRLLIALLIVAGVAHVALLAPMFVQFIRSIQS